MAREESFTRLEDKSKRQKVTRLRKSAFALGFWRMGSTNLSFELDERTLKGISQRCLSHPRLNSA